MICKNCGFRVDNQDLLYCPNCNSYLKEVENNDNMFFSPEFTSQTINTVDIPRPEQKVDNNINVVQNNPVEIDDIIEIKKEPVKNFNPGKIVAFIVIIIWIVAIVILVNGTGGKSFYFEKEEPESNVATEEVLKENDKTYTATSKSKQKGVAGNGVTSVIYDNQYLKQMILNDRNDLDKLIVEDSENNRKNCSQEILDIEKSIQTNYGINAVNLCELDVRFARELENVAKYIYENFPTARGRITNLTLANVDKNASYMASFMPMFTFITSKTSTKYPLGVKTIILLNAKYFLNPSRLSSSVSYGANSGYFPKNATRSSTVAHEFGHYLSYVAMLNHYEEKELNFVKINRSSVLNDIYNDFKIGTFSNNLIKEAYDKYLNKHNGTLNYYEFRASISKYAVAQNDKGEYIYDETIAEAFHDVYLNGNKAVLASKLIVETLIEHL